MRQLRDDTHLIVDGEVRVYRREQKPIDTKIYSRPTRLTNSATALTRTHLRARGTGSYSEQVSAKNSIRRAIMGSRLVLRSTVLNVSFAKCAISAPCCLVTAKAYVQMKHWTTKKTGKYLNLCDNMRLWGNAQIRAALVTYVWA